MTWIQIAPVLLRVQSLLFPVAFSVASLRNRTHKVWALLTEKILDGKAFVEEKKVA